MNLQKSQTRLNTLTCMAPTAILLRLFILGEVKGCQVLWKTDTRISSFTSPGCCLQMPLHRRVKGTSQNM